VPTANRKSISVPRWARIAAVLLVFFVLFLTWRYTPLSEFATAERMMEWARSVRSVAWAPLALIAIYTPAAFVMFPRPLITLFSVIAFGPWRGFVFSMLGIIGSALATYYVGRALPDKTLRRIAGKRLEKTSKAVRKRGFVSVLAVTVAPVAPFPVVGMVAGAIRIKLWQYVLGTVLGMAPGTLATTVFARQIENALENPELINYWVVAAVIAILVALVFVSRRWMLKVQAEA
jgi:uncharacterized membrane protein YdjX (TVP38/TMEM64 family)